jgi:hypothetical protein
MENTEQGPDFCDLPKQKTTFFTSVKKVVGNNWYYKCTNSATSTSLRWYDPDQVLRVSKAHFDLSLSKGPPSGIHHLFTFIYLSLS